MPKINREVMEMADRLEVQLNLLEEHGRRAFGEHKLEYCAEVATKLRLLLVRSKANKPLLLEVADRIGHELTLVLGGPPIDPLPGEPRAGETITLDRFFDLMAVYVQTSEGPIQLTKRELIRAWCEQLGGAHEDWAVSEALSKSLQSPITLNGLQPTAYELMKCAETVLQFGRRVVTVAKAQPEGDKNGV
jgi:hypothetical protein